VNYRHLAGALALSAAIATAACGDDPPPTQPTPAPAPPPPPANPVLTAPTVDSPAEDAQLSTLRPTLIVRKATSDQVGPRSYEFQVSDDPDFQPASASNVARHYKLVAAQANIPEGPNDATFNVPADLQPSLLALVPSQQHPLGGRMDDHGRARHVDRRGPAPRVP